MGGKVSTVKITVKNYPNIYSALVFEEVFLGSGDAPIEVKVKESKGVLDKAEKQAKALTPFQLYQLCYNEEYKEYWDEYLVSSPDFHKVSAQFFGS